jgi:hypothetical protein
MTTRRRDRCPYCGTPGNGEPCDPSCPPRQPPQTPAQLAAADGARSTASLVGPATPGQLCYQAYWRSSAHGRVPVAWPKLLPHWQAQWEAAAQAVLAIREEKTP